MRDLESVCTIFLCIDKGEPTLKVCVGGECREDGKISWGWWCLIKFRFLGTRAPSHPSPATYLPCGSQGRHLPAPAPALSLSFFLVNWPETCSLPWSLGRWLHCEEMRGQAARTITGPWVTPPWPEFLLFPFSLKSHLKLLQSERIKSHCRFLSASCFTLSPAE